MARTFGYRFLRHRGTRELWLREWIRGLIQFEGESSCEESSLSSPDRQWLWDRARSLAISRRSGPSVTGSGSGT